jgi:hypothetical protein
MMSPHADAERRRAPSRPVAQRRDDVGNGLGVEARHLARVLRLRVGEHEEPVRVVGPVQRAQRERRRRLAAGGGDRRVRPARSRRRASAARSPPAR